MKKWFGLSLLLVLFLAVVCAQADETGPCGENLTYEYDSGTHSLYIFVTHSDMPGGAITKTDWSAAVKNQATSLTIFETTQIDNYVFNEFKSLKSVGLPYGIEKLCFGAFMDCGALTDINLPDSLTVIEVYAFNYCESLDNLEFPDSLAEIGLGSFYRNLSLKKVSLPDKIKTIPKYCFYNCSGMTDLKLPASLESIEQEAFGSCYHLKTLSLPPKTKSLGSACFQYCSGLQSVSVPASVKDVGDECFSGCEKLSLVTVESRDAVFGKDVFSNDPNLTIRGYRGSTAEAYAKANGIPFESLDWIVSFSAGGGSGTMKEQSVIKGQKYTLPACAFTAPDGKEFDAWDKGAAGVKIDVTADTVITALWKDIPGAPGTGSDPAPGADPGSAPGAGPGDAGVAEQVTLKKIKIKRVVAVSKKKLMVEWKKLSSKDRKKIKKIQVQVSTDKKFDNIIFEKFISSKKTLCSVSGLKKNTKYYVRIRAFTEKDGVRYVSPWSGIKNKKTKKK